MVTETGTEWLMPAAVPVTVRVAWLVVGVFLELLPHATVKVIPVASRARHAISMRLFPLADPLFLPAKRTVPNRPRPDNSIMPGPP